MSREVNVERDEAVVRMDAQMWSLVAELQALITEREAMVALNMQRQACGNSMAYDDEAFMGLAQQMKTIGAALWNKI